MPKKIRELKALLNRAGFEMHHGKGSHTNWYHPKYTGRVTIPGNDGADAKRYLENLVARAIKKVSAQ
jgi:predicted RNA binding protein YcfA (HicA-like mRNA interferase family)